MESFSSTFPSGSRFLGVSFVRVPCTASTHGRVVWLAVRRVDVALDTCTSPCTCFRLPFRTRPERERGVFRKDLHGGSCTVRKGGGLEKDGCESSLETGEEREGGRGGEGTSVHPVEPERLVVGGIQRCPNDRRLEIPIPMERDHPQEEAGTSTPNRRKGIYLVPLPPTRSDGCPPRHRKRCSDREGTKDRRLGGE